MVDRKMAHIAIFVLTFAVLQLTIDAENNAPYELNEEKTGEIFGGMDDENGEEGRDTACVDRNQHCVSWAGEGACSGGKNQTYMRQNCKHACGLCPGPADFFNYKMTMGDGESAAFSLGLSEHNSHANTYSRSYRAGSASEDTMCGRVTAVPYNLRFITRYNYYRKYTHAYNIPIVSTSAVSDAALNRACYVLQFLLADRKRLRKYLYLNYGRLGIIGTYEQTTDIPEHRWLGPSWNQRARGLGGTLAVPISTGTEENLLCDQRRDSYRDRYPNEDIFLHEFAHGIQEVAIRGGGIPGYFERLQAAYRRAKYSGLWRNTYAMSTVQEYFAEGTQSYFEVNEYSSYANGVHGPIDTREKLRRYDPTLYNLVREVFPCGNKIWKRCDARFKRKPMPAFRMNCDGDGEMKWIGGKGVVPVTTKPKVTRPKVTQPKVTQPKVTQKPQPPIPTENKCKDLNQHCKSWASYGYCASNPKYMLISCKTSCACCHDTNTKCPGWKSYCNRSGWGAWMDKNCKKTCNTCENVVAGRRG